MAKCGVVPDCNACDIEHDGAEDGRCCTVIFCDLHKQASTVAPIAKDLSENLKWALEALEAVGIAEWPDGNGWSQDAVGEGLKMVREVLARAKAAGVLV